MTDYYVFRHGDTSESVKTLYRLLIYLFGKKRDTRDLDILPSGVAALEKIGAYLKNIHTDINFTSPYLRCVKSAEIVGKIANKKFVLNENLRELESKGEKFSSFHKRVSAFLKEVEGKKYSAVTICTHGAVIAAIKHLKIDGRFYFFQVVDYPNPGNLTIIKEGKLDQINFN